MSIIEIEKFLSRQNITDETSVLITFRKRPSIKGIFVKGRDFDELKEKNFWRIVTASNYGEWMHSKKMDAARLFNGVDFLKLEHKDSGK